MAWWWVQPCEREWSGAVAWPPAVRETLLNDPDTAVLMDRSGGRVLASCKGRGAAEAGSHSEHWAVPAVL